MGSLVKHNDRTFWPFFMNYKCKIPVVFFFNLPMGSKKMGVGVLSVNMELDSSSYHNSWIVINVTWNGSHQKFKKHVKKFVKFAMVIVQNWSRSMFYFGSNIIWCFLFPQHCSWLFHWWITCSLFTRVFMLYVVNRIPKHCWRSNSWSVSWWSSPLEKRKKITASLLWR